MNKVITEDLLNQIRLMNYDRSKTVFEQITTPDKRKGLVIGPKENPFQSVSKPKTKWEVEAQKIYNELEPEISSLVYFDEENVVNIVKRINNDNYLPLLLILLGKGYSSVMDYLMTQFDKPSYDESSIAYPGWGDVYNYTSNDMYVYEISNHLKKFSNINTGEGDYKMAEWNETALMKTFTRTAHVVLPVVSFVMTLGASSLVWVAVAGAIEAVDASIYFLVDKDPYAAGLSLIFAFAGSTDYVLKGLVQKYGKSILSKMAKKQSLNKAELATVDYVSRNQSRLLSKTYQQIALRTLKFNLISVKSLNLFVEFLYYLVKEAYLGVKFVTEFGIVVGGSFVTWDKIASLYGICNSVQLKDLEKANYKILKLIGSAGPYLQPFTKGCDTTEGEKVFSKMDKTLENRRISMNFEKMIETNTVLSTKYSKVKMIETLVLQEALNYFDYGMINKKSDRYEREIEGKKKTKAECDTMDGLEKLHYPECLDYLKTVKTQNKEFSDMVFNDTKGEKAINKNYKSPEYGISKTLLNRINWGFYDEQTKAMVELFQKDNNLEVNGDANDEVFKILKTKVESLTEKQISIPNYSKFEWSEEEIKKLRKKAYSELKKEKEKTGKPTFTKEEAESAFQAQKTKVITDVEKEFEKVNPNLSERQIKDLDSAIINLEKY